MEIACQYSRRRKGEDIAERLLLYSSPLGCEHIGYFENTTALPEKVPFEWYAGKDGSPVLLLWLDETAFFMNLCIGLMYSSSGFFRKKKKGGKSYYNWFSQTEFQVHRPAGSRLICKLWWMNLKRLQLR
ncbi:MAG: hypothetical protein PHF31_09710 [Methylobacter sp.]|nr:hypothetical protein [Methylobacter sp.]